MPNQKCVGSCFFVAVFLIGLSTGNVVQLTDSNLDQVLSNNELVFVNFYADWCRFSQLLTPVFDSAATKVKQAYPEDGRVVFARINCDVESGLANRFQVTKYPTMKLFRVGKMMRREYRGQRSDDAIFDFIKSQLSSPVTILASPEEIFTTDINKRSIIGSYENAESIEYKTFLQVAKTMKDDCTFFASFRPAQNGEVDAGNTVSFHLPGSSSPEVTYPGPASDYAMLHQWCDEKCFPAVRELTFDNAEELTEEGLPFFILFHSPDDYTTPERFRAIVASELSDEKRTVNFLVANGLKFSHPLHHLGKSANDLPVIAIDSFRHMYLWKNDVRTDIDKPGLLKQFIADLHSGKLHREFHQGPDPTRAPVTQPPVGAIENHAKQETGEVVPDAPHVPKEADPQETTERLTERSTEEGRTSPPESIFRKLAPSRNRYTILRDEL